MDGDRIKYSLKGIGLTKWHVLYALQLECCLFFKTLYINLHDLAFSQSKQIRLAQLKWRELY